MMGQAPLVFVWAGVSGLGEGGGGGPIGACTLFFETLPSRVFDCVPLPLYLTAP